MSRVSGPGRAKSVDCAHGRRGVEVRIGGHFGVLRARRRVRGDACSSGSEASHGTCHCGAYAGHRGDRCQAHAHRLQSLSTYLGPSGPTVPQTSGRSKS